MIEPYRQFEVETVIKEMSQQSSIQADTANVSVWKQRRLEALEKESLDRKRQQKRQLLRKLKTIKKEIHYLEDAYKQDSVLCESLKSELKQVEDQLDCFSMDINKNQLRGRVERDCQKWISSGCKKSGKYHLAAHDEVSDPKNSFTLLNFIPLLLFLMVLLLLSSLGA